MTKMTGPDCAAMFKLINTHTHTHTLGMRDAERTGGNVHVYGHHIYSRLGINRYSCQSCSWSAEQEKIFFPCPRSPLENLVS